MRSRLVQNTIHAALPFIESADGVWLTDTSGKRYIDGCSGAVVTGIGHGNRHVLQAMAEQASRISFTHRGAFSSASAEQLADRLGQMTGYPGVWFVNSGSEAIEAAMQFALQHHRESGQGKRQSFLSFNQGYHGNTLGCLSLSGHVRRIAAGDLTHEFALLPTPYYFRDNDGRSEAQYTLALLSDARTKFEESGDTLAAVVIEPVGGATLGATVPPPEYLRGIQTLCSEFGALLITDEVMTGLGRTGMVLAAEHSGIVGDLVALGKGLGAGYTPIAATLVSQQVLDSISAGSGRVYGGHTYAGNPLSTAVAHAVLDVLEDDDVIAHGRQMGAVLRHRLIQIAAVHPVIADVRGAGLLLALEFHGDVPEGASSVPQGELTHEIVQAVKEAGALIYGTTGGFNEAALVAPPLTITPGEVEILVDVIDRALTRWELRTRWRS